MVEYNKVCALFGYWFHQRFSYRRSH